MRSLIIGIILFLVYAGFVYAQSFGDVLRIDQPVLSDKYVAGRIIQVTAKIDGDLSAAGQRLIIEGEVQGDINTAGESIDLRAPVSDDVRAAGRYIRINNAVAGHIVAAGDTILLGPGSLIGEWVWLAGRSIEVEGHIGGELRAAGRSILFKAEVNGDAILTGKKIQLESGTVIHGDLIVHSSEEPLIAVDAEVKGEVILNDVPKGIGEQGRFSQFSTIGATLLLMVSIIIPVLALIILFPQASGIAIREVRRNPLSILGLGFSIAILSPAIIIILFVTGIGFVIGLLILGTYLLVLLMGILLGMAVCGQYMLDKFTNEKELGLLRKVLIVTLTSALFLALAWLPVFGQILMLVVWTAGLGVAVKGAWSCSLSALKPTKA